MKEDQWTDCPCHKLRSSHTAKLNALMTTLILLKIQFVPSSVHIWQVHQWKVSYKCAVFHSGAITHEAFLGEGRHTLTFYSEYVNGLGFIKLYNLFTLVVSKDIKKRIKIPFIHQQYVHIYICFMYSISCHLCSYCVL